MNRILNYTICIAILFSTFSCRSRRADKIEMQGGMVLSAEDSLRNNIIKSYTEADYKFNYFTAKAKVQAKVKSQDYNLTLNVRIKHNDKIWISVNTFGSIEVARILCTRDSIFIIDKINKQYIVRDYALISQLLKTEVDYYSLESLLLGNALLKYSMNNSVLSKNETAYSLVKQENNEKVELGIRKIDSKLIYFLYEQQSGVEPSKFEVNYGDFKLIKAQNFPYTIKIDALTAKETLSINFVYVKAENVETLDFPFNVPKRFE